MEVIAQEVWKDVKGFEGRYRISNRGRLLSTGGKYKKPKVICPSKTDSGGYYNVSLRFKKGGIPRYCVRVHQLVAEHFCDKPETTERLEIDHDDCNRLNNYYKNLVWLTSTGHRRRSIEKGEIDLKGENHPHVKLTKKSVLKMRELYATGNYTQKELGAMFGVCRRQAGDVINKVNWSWL